MTETSDVAVIGERALTIKEAAKLLRVSYGTIYARREELGFFQIGSVWRIWPDDLKKAVSEQDYHKRRRRGRNRRKKHVYPKARRCLVH